MPPITRPLLHLGDPDSPIAWRDGVAVSRRRFLAQARALAESLPDGRHVVNLCFDRYHFMVAFAAALLRGQITLLPPNRAPQVIQETADDYDAYCLCDAPLDGVRRPMHRLQLEDGATDGGAAPQIDVAQPAIVIFTSGSTGKPSPNLKTWGQLSLGTELALRRFGLDAATHHLLATVPPQHMYGMESSVLYALLGPSAVHAGQPFYPEDLRRALAQLPAPRVLVTTPVHLRALTRAGLAWPETAFVLCATAPLDTELAAASEAAFGAPLHEIYGFTEAGAVASRETLRDADWRLYDGMALERRDDDWLITGPQLAAAQTITDRLEVSPGGRFRLIGRKADLVNIAGKRTTLGELNRRLLAIPGVVDGCFVQPDPERERLAALVVAPTLEEAELLRQLALCMDPVFLPRPLVKLATLPRTDTGKLPRQLLLNLIGNARLSA